MDPELIAYFDQHFRENTQQISALREEMAQRFDQVNQRVDQVNQRVEQVNQRVERIDQRSEQTDQRVERLEATSRQTLILVESLRGDVHLIAEGFVGNSDRLERFQKEATLVFDEVKGWIEPYYRNLDGRLRVIESQDDRRQGDVLDAVRRMLGKPLQAK
jgi:chromosome segregation ATPase